MLLALDYEALGDDVSDSDVSEWREAATKEEPVVHVKVSPRGEWHRMTVDKRRTACGKELGAYATRDESYDGRLCTDGCFSGYELGLAAEMKAAAENARHHEQERANEQHERPSQLSKDIAESRERRRSQQMQPVIDDED